MSKVKPEAKHKAEAIPRKRIKAKAQATPKR